MPASGRLPPVETDYCWITLGGAVHITRSPVATCTLCGKLVLCALPAVPPSSCPGCNERLEEDPDGPAYRIPEELN